MIYKNTPQEVYYVYIIECNDRSYYTGLTNDLLKRFEEHYNGVYTECYTFNIRPLHLRYYETIPFLNEGYSGKNNSKAGHVSKKQHLWKVIFIN